MPVIDLKFNIEVGEVVLDAVVADVTQALAGCLNEVCASVMISTSYGPLHVDRSSAPAALVAVRTAVDLCIETKRCLCQLLGDILTHHCAISPCRVYLQLSHISPEDAWNITPVGPRCALDRTLSASNQSISARL
jgi:hypothetical protein